MTVRLAVVMDPIGSIHYHKDTTLAMLWEAQARGWQIHYFEVPDLYVRDGRAYGRGRSLVVRRDPAHWFDWTNPAQEQALAAFDVILMRKDPPFDQEYLYATYILEFAETEGALIVNRPQALRDANEKLYLAQFPDCAPPLLVTSAHARLIEFLDEHQDILLKPLDAMGGSSVFRLRRADPNVNVTIEMLTQRGARHIMAQRFLPEIAHGDKRILLIDGEPVPYALARHPKPGETRANLAVGGTYSGVELSVRDRWLCAQLAPSLRSKGLLFVGIDVIGEFVTEINVTSPTCARELDALYGINIAGQLLDAIASKLAAAR
ncbi:MAG: glutathione synthase [Pseudomonadota bacterium]|nr:MAG: glutathione synthase [Pseudomonadota bacterium]